MPLRIDPKSVASHSLTLYAFSRPVGVGTGFIVGVDELHLLVTNYHVLSGRHPQSGNPLGPAPMLPDRVLIPYLRKTGPNLRWRPSVQRLFDENQRPLWVEHPRHGRRFDVVVLPLIVPPDALIVPYLPEPGPDLALVPGSELAIIGFPEGMSSVGITALWKSGAIASEPELSSDEEPFFWIDANTRRGMSGSPVVARRFGGAMMATGDFALHAGIVDRTVGVYAGRALEAPDMTLGRVWKWDGVQEIIEEAASRIHRGLLAAHVSFLGHHTNEETLSMVKLDVRRSIDVNVRNAAGEVESRTIAVGELLKEFVLGDDRFGLDLERVRLAASVEAAISHAEQNGTDLELEDGQYGLIREVIMTPTKPYNPAVARYLLPLLDYILQAGGELTIA